MNPIPLKSPDGTVYSYACGTCHQVPAHPTVGGLRSVPPVSVVSSIQLRAASCCTCFGQCGTPRPPDSSRVWRCRACQWRAEWLEVWRDIGREYAGPPDDAHPSEHCKCADGKHGERHDEGCRWAKVMCQPCNGFGYCPSCHGEGVGPVTIVECEVPASALRMERP